ncbi:BTB/POZ domain-containing protein 6-A-like [Oculina patagonica]
MDFSQKNSLAADDCQVNERGISMFNNKLLSDVSLVVRASSDEGEPKKSKMAIPAHKFVLSICSPVFFAMFCGELAEKSDSVDLPDCEYEGVLEMLRYMYGGEAELNENNMLEVLYVAKKYIVESLVDECMDFVQNNLNPANVFWVLSHAQQYDEKILVDQCWDLIDRETEEAVKSEGFATIERSLLEAVVKRDSLTIKEVDLFKAVDLWASMECERQGLTPDGNVKRCILGEVIVKLVRFPVMEEKEFASVVLNSEILKPQEVVNVREHFNSVLTTPVGFCGDKRRGTYQSCFRFNDAYEGSQVHPENCIHFHVNKDIVLHGIRLFGSKNNEIEVIFLTVEEIHSGHIVVNKSGKFSSALFHKKYFHYYGYDVMFNPVYLSQGCRYYVKVKTNGPKSYSGSCGDSEVTSHGVTFFFRNYCSNCYTSTGSGQFPDFLFKLQ